MGLVFGLIERLGEIALIVFGFGVVVFIHELGHFVAARWAGVRVQAFALGFGPALLSWRRGLGVRRGSSVTEYEALTYAAEGERGEARESARALLSGRVSPTEYRLNWLPLGGYVKMLGQDDADPSHRSAEPDSYNSVAVWKRMVIISAGVIANLVSAAALFVVVFSMGLAAPSPVIGSVADGSPAALAAPSDSGVGEGLLPGDRVVGIGDAVPRSFNDVMTGVLTASPGKPVTVTVDRAGVGALSFEVSPERSSLGIQEIGVGAAGSTRLMDLPQLGPMLSALELGPVRPGWRIESVDGAPVAFAHEVQAAVDRARGEAVVVAFAGPDGDRHEARFDPTPALPSVRVQLGDGVAQHRILAGFVPVMMVGEAEAGSAASSRGYELGLRTGDVFVRLGGYEYPNAAEGMSAIRAGAGGVVPATVWRDGEEIAVPLDVRANGTVGFLVSETSDADDPRISTLVSAAPGDGRVRPGSRVVGLNGEPVVTFRALAQRLQGLAGASPDGLGFAFTVAPPVGDVEQDGSVELSPVETARVAALGWDLPVAVLAVEPEEIILRSEGPVDAIGLGLAETKRIMTMTYLTFVRLAQGSIAPKVLNGPVGIVHTGTTLVDRGPAWLLFFFALVSVNLAVINFLPIPITDGGHMVFLLWEQATGKPVSIAVQNVATLAGLLLIVGVFLFVTYHDLARLLGS